MKDKNFQQILPTTFKVRVNIYIFFFKLDLQIEDHL
jgi:hypothetical protein